MPLKSDYWRYFVVQGVLAICNSLKLNLLTSNYLQYDFQHILRLFCFFQFSMYAGVQGYEQCSLNNELKKNSPLIPFQLVPK